MLNAIDADIINEEKSINQDNVCNKCKNFEQNISCLQETERDLKEQLAAAQELASRYEKELSGERSYRKELESKLSALNIDTKTRIGKCLETNNNFEERFNLIAKNQEKNFNTMQQELNRACSKYKSLKSDFLKLHTRYSKLLGINKEKASEMREKNIELPRTVDQLQFLALQLREELIETRAAYEHSVNELRDELVIAREQCLELEDKLREVDQLFNDSDLRLNSVVSNERSPQDNKTVVSLNAEILRYQSVIAELEHQIALMQKDRTKNEIFLNEYKQKCITLQQELDVCETVQKDFVQLSQKLQIQLEKIRQAEKEVRWQFKEDVDSCNKCELSFDTKNKKDKFHCKHCGKIFCQDCLVNKVYSGPNRRGASVCDVCYTLLNRESVPFFSNTESNNIP